MVQRLSIYSLGPLDVEIDSRSLAELSGGKMSALLMLMATRPGDRLRRDTLADMLWPNLSIQSARTNLRHIFFHLREALGSHGQEPFLLSDRDWLGFNPRSDFWMDALDLAAAASRSATPEVAEIERRARLYRGEFMAGFSLPDCPEFEDWLEAQRGGLRRQAVALLEYLAHSYEVGGHCDRALEYARRLSELDPLSEAAHRRVIRLCARSGRPDAAHAQYAACRARLRQELGALPNEETTALLRQVLDGGGTAGRLRTSEEVPALPAPPTERRQVTVLYCELTLAGVEDPDEAAEQLRRPQQRCVDIVRRHGGYVSQSHGGGLLAYFGYPDAREDAARRATTAAQAMCDAAAPAVARCGVHTGLIVTAPGLPTPDVVGRASELASRLRLAAGERGVALSRQTFRLVDGYVRCVALGALTQAEGDRPVEVYRVEGSSGAQHRLAAAATLSPFVGRAEEARRLRAAWEGARGGHPAAVLVRGDPGIGKSRLVAEVRREVVAQESCAVLELLCLPEHQATPFFPFAGILQVATPPAPPGSSAEVQRRRLIDAMVEALLAMASRRPLLMVMEDVQWADASSLELLRAAIERLRDERILILLTGRPEFGPPWRHGSKTRTLELEHLPAAPSRQLAAGLLTSPSAERIERIIAQADGVPLFIEELARWQETGERIPATLHDLLMARIDRLGGARRLAQVGAALGRDFEPKLLAAVLKDDGVDVERGVQDLLRSGLVLDLRERLQFKHALIQEAAYESQSRALRRDTHRRVAEVLQRDFGDRCRMRPETLAHHFTEAGEIEPAICSWRAAAAAAEQCWSHLEAVLHYRQALALLTQLPPSREREKLELSLRVALARQIISEADYGNPERSQEVEECLDRANSLCRENEDAEQVFLVVYGQLWALNSSGSHVRAEELTGHLAHFARRSERVEFIFSAHAATAETLFWMGRYADMPPHVEAAQALLPRVEPGAYIQIFGVDPCVFIFSFFTLSRWFLGRPDEAARLAQEVTAAAERSGHANSKCIVLSMWAILDRYERRPQKVLEHCEALTSLAETHRLPFWPVALQSFRGWALAMQGEAEGAAQALQVFQQVLKSRPSEVTYADIYIEALAALGRHDQVLAEVDVLIDAARRRCHGLLLPELFRLKGEALAAASSKNRDAAEACMRDALDEARRGGARLLELRAATSLFRSRRDSGTRKLLEELTAHFDERSDLSDVLEARALARGIA